MMDIGAVRPKGVTVMGVECVECGRNVQRGEAVAASPVEVKWVCRECHTLAIARLDKARADHFEWLLSGHAPLWQALAD